MLELVEAHYSPRVKEDCALIKRHKQGLEQIDREIFKLEEEKGKVKVGATPEQLKEYKDLQKQRDWYISQINLIGEMVEEKVLDSELFLREAKQHMLTEPK